MKWTIETNGNNVLDLKPEEMQSQFNGVRLTVTQLMNEIRRLERQLLEAEHDGTHELLRHLVGIYDDFDGDDQPLSEAIEKSRKKLAELVEKNQDKEG